MSTVDGARRGRPRVCVVFDSAGFDGSRPLTGAAVRTERLAAHLYRQGVHVELLLADLNAESWPTTDWPMPMRYLRPGDLDRPQRLARLAAATRPDVLVIATAALLVRVGHELAAATGAALVYEMHDDDADLSRQLGDPAEAETVLVQQAAVRAADAVIAFTARDVDAARRMGAAATWLLPCGTDPGPAPHPAPEAQPRIALLGNFVYEPNRRALDWAATVLAPVLPPGTVIDAIGRRPGEQEACSERVRLRGPVPEVRPVLEGAALGIAPLEIGAGMKLKVLDYAAAGVAIVGTPEAFVGFPSPQEWAVCAALEDLPRQVLALLADPARRHRLGSAARDMAASRFAWPDIAARAREIYAEIAAAPRRGVAPSPAARQAAAADPYWLREWHSHLPHPATGRTTP